MIGWRVIQKFFEIGNRRCEKEEAAEGVQKLVNVFAQVDRNLKCVPLVLWKEAPQKGMKKEKSVMDDCFGFDLSQA